MYFFIAYLLNKLTGIDIKAAIKREDGK